MPGQARHFSSVTSGRFQRLLPHPCPLKHAHRDVDAYSTLVLFLLKKIDGFILAIFIYSGFSNACLLCDSSAAIAAVRSRSPETRLPLP